MTKAVRLLLAVCALAAVALVAGCGGNSVPGNAVASVDGNAIDLSQFNHWMNIAAKSSGSAGAVAPDPPNFTKCVAQKRKTTPAPGKGKPKVTDAQLKAQCQQSYNTLRDQVVSLLVSYRWIQGEAKARHISVTNAEVQKSFQQQKKQNFPKEADYQKFLKQYGQTEADILERVRLDLLSTKIRNQVVKGKGNVSQAQITAFYNKNKSRFTTPETRDLQIVLTKNQGTAAKARKAIASGTPWAKVAKQYSIDTASKAKGGKLPGQAKGSLEKTLNTAVFSASKGKLVGPIKTQFGWYVFRVTKVHPGSTQPQSAAQATIKQTLVSQNQQNALNAFVNSFRNRWRAKTDCRKGYVTSDCSNGPKPTPTPSATAVPGG
jgi:foldase protein PrsA